MHGTVTEDSGATLHFTSLHFTSLSLDATRARASPPSTQAPHRSASRRIPILALGSRGRRHGTLGFWPLQPRDFLRSPMATTLTQLRCTFLLLTTLHFLRSLYSVAYSLSSLPGAQFLVPGRRSKLHSIYSTPMIRLLHCCERPAHHMASACLVALCVPEGPACCSLPQSARGTWMLVSFKT